MRNLLQAAFIATTMAACVIGDRYATGCQRQPKAEAVEVASMSSKDTLAAVAYEWGHMMGQPGAEI